MEATSHNFEEEVENEILDAQIESSFVLKEDLLEGVEYAGWKPNHVHHEVFEAIQRGGRDLIAQAEAGIGTVCVSALQKVVAAERRCQTIILSPTAALAKDYGEALKQISHHMGDVRIHECGEKTWNRLQLRHSQILVGVPEPISNIIRPQWKKFVCVKLLVIVEADKVLTNRFEDQLKIILDSIPPETQIVLISAAPLSPKARRMASFFIENPVMIFEEEEELTVRGRHVALLIDAGLKFETVVDVFDKRGAAQAVIFCDHLDEVRLLAEYMNELDYAVKVVHDELSWDERRTTMTDFSNANFRILITSGHLTQEIVRKVIESQEVGLVINFSIPDTPTYIRRVGRTARLGLMGTVVNLVTAREVALVRSIESELRIVMSSTLPSSTLP